MPLLWAATPAQVNQNPANKRGSLFLHNSRLDGVTCGYYVNSLILQYNKTIQEKGKIMAQQYYKIIYQEHGLRKEKRICAYNISDALVQAKSLQHLRWDILVLYVKNIYGRCVWL